MDAFVPLMEENEDVSPNRGTLEDHHLQILPSEQRSLPPQNREIPRFSSSEYQLSGPPIDNAATHWQYRSHDSEIDAEPERLPMQVPSADNDLATIMRECNIRLLKHRLRSLKRRLFLEQVYAMAQDQAPPSDIQAHPFKENQNIPRREQCAASPHGITKSSNNDNEFRIPLTARSQPETINRMTTHAA